MDRINGSRLDAQQSGRGYLVTSEIIMQGLGYIVGGAAVYAAIKSDLTRAIVLAEQAAEAAKGAHQRIDNYIGGNHHGN